MARPQSRSPGRRLARRARVALAAALLAGAAISISGGEHAGRGGGAAAGVPVALRGAQGPPAPPVTVAFRREPPSAGGSRPCLERRRLQRARSFAARRAGSVSFAFMDECGRLLGEHRYRVYESASAVKAMLLVAYLRHDDVPERELTAGERDLLGRMIEWSDNDAADAVFATVGEAGLNEVADVAGMHRFEFSPAWGGSGITAADQAGFMARLERYVPRRHEDFAMRKLAGVVGSQRWGVPEHGPRHWSVHLKGGWYPLEGGGWRVNQVATLRRGSRSLGVAVLTEGDPSFGYGTETVAGVAQRLLGGYPR